MEQIDKVLAIKCSSNDSSTCEFLHHNFTSVPNHVYYLKLFQKNAAMKRRIKLKPETVAEYTAPVNYEMELYNWTHFDTCVKCMSEINLVQCIDKSDCSHIFCLHCALEALNDVNFSDYIWCPVCLSYCAGALEKFTDKSVINVAALKVLYSMFHHESKSFGKVLEIISNERLCRLSANINGLPLEYLQAVDRIVNQPECYENIQNLDKFELLPFKYRDDLSELMELYVTLTEL